MVAFVGSGAEQYIPSPKGIDLICWDKEGCTSPDAIRKLRKRMVNVFFAENLHMKVYWAQGRGLVLGSANLSKNGLGDGALFEAATLLPAGLLSIADLRKSVDPKPVTAKMLESLDRRTRKYRSRNHGKTVFSENGSQPSKQSFADWYHSKDQVSWRLFAYWEYLSGLTKEAQQRLDSEGYESCEDYWMGIKEHAVPYEWLLAVDMNKKSNGIHWSCPDFAVDVKPSDKNFYDKREPVFAVQCSKTTVYGEVPFDEREKPFRAALRSLLKENKMKTYEEGLAFAPKGRMSKKNLRRLYELYRDHGQRK